MFQSRLFHRDILQTNEAIYQLFSNWVFVADGCITYHVRVCFFPGQWYTA